MPRKPAIWFPAVQAGTGADMFTIRLADALDRRGIRAEITWLPHRAEYAPWTVPVPRIPPWVNVVHINSWLHGRFIPAGLPLVVTLHSCVHDPALEPYKSRLQRLYHQHWIKACETEALRRANVVTAVSQYTADQAAMVFERSDIIPIHNWIDTELFQPDDRQIPNQPFRLLFVGNLNRRKGADLLPEIMRRLGKEFELHYTGSSSQFSNKEHLPPNMTALGRLHGADALAETYRACDALLFPTRLEGLSLVTLEALACGRPIIATYCSSLPEVVEDGRNGILCAVDNIERFVSAIQSLKQNPVFWWKMCIEARNRAIYEFGETVAVNKFETIYETLLKKHVLIINQ